MVGVKSRSSLCLCYRFRWGIDQPLHFSTCSLGCWKTATRRNRELRGQGIVLKLSIGTLFLAWINQRNHCTSSNARWNLLAFAFVWKDLACTDRHCQNAVASTQMLDWVLALSTSPVQSEVLCCWHYCGVFIVWYHRGKSAEQADLIISRDIVHKSQDPLVFWIQNNCGLVLFAWLENSVVQFITNSDILGRLVLLYARTRHELTRDELMNELPFSSEKEIIHQLVLVANTAAYFGTPHNSNKSSWTFPFHNPTRPVPAQFEGIKKTVQIKQGPLCFFSDVNMPSPFDLVFGLELVESQSVLKSFSRFCAAWKRSGAAHTSHPVVVHVTDVVIVGLCWQTDLFPQTFCSMDSARPRKDPCSGQDVTTVEGGWTEICLSKIFPIVWAVPLRLFGLKSGRKIQSCWTSLQLCCNIDPRNSCPSCLWQKTNIPGLYPRYRLQSCCDKPDQVVSGCQTTVNPLWILPTKTYINQKRILTWAYRRFYA